MSTSVERYSLSHIRPYHREIARRLVLGQTQTQVAKALNMSTSRISIIINSPLFKLELKRLEKIRDEGVGDIGQTLRELSPVALETIERTMYQAPSDRLRFDAAKDILDRAGHGAINKSIVGNVGGGDYSNLTMDELRKLVKERVHRMENEINKKAQEASEADAIEVDFDEVVDATEEERSNGERKLPINLLGDISDG